MEAVAHLKFARTGPRKLRRVADAIRGLHVREALTLLKFSGVFASEPMEKLLRSAMANAENNHDMSGDDLYVARVTVDGGPGGRFTKRLDPRAQGRAYFKRKRMSHVTIAVSEEAPKKQRPRRSGASVQAAHRPNVSAKPATASAKPRTRKKAAAAAGATS